jgi:hypothetical protein
VTLSLFKLLLKIENMVGVVSPTFIKVTNSHCLAVTLPEVGRGAVDITKFDGLGTQAQWSEPPRDREILVRECV